MFGLLHMREFQLLSVFGLLERATDSHPSMVTLIVADWLGFITK